MSTDDEPAAGFSLRRWSRRKLAAARDLPGAPPLPPADVPADPRNMLPAAPDAPATTTATAAATATATAPAASGGGAMPPAAALPPVDTLTFESDFTAYLQPKVGEALKRTALRKLFRDPRFNVMDGLDVYIDDYSIPDPISAEMVRGLVQSRNIFDPPQTRINAAGCVEDVPADERVPVAAQTGADAPAALPATEDSVAAVSAPPAWPAADAAPAAGAADAAAPAPDAVTRDPAAPEAEAPTHPAAAPRSVR